MKVLTILDLCSHFTFLFVFIYLFLLWVGYVSYWIEILWCTVSLGLAVAQGYPLQPESLSGCHIRIKTYLPTAKGRKTSVSSRCFMMNSWTFSCQPTGNIRALSLGGKNTVYKLWVNMWHEGEDVHICGAHGGWKSWTPWSRSCRELKASQHGCWEPNSVSLQEQCSLLTTKPSFQHYYLF